MRRFLRTASTRRLLAAIAGLVAVIAAGTAIAVAASGNGPVPAPKPLATAVHQAFSAPAVQGITARITFTNHLIDASNIQGSDPILSGATGRLWLSNDHRLRIELQSDNGDAQAVFDKGTFWVYDPTSKTVYEGNLPASATREKTAKGNGAIPSIAQIQQDINRLSQHINVSGAIPGDVAGQPAYTVRVTPKHDGGLLGAGELAWDAIRGVPLRIAVYAKDSSSPVLELKATDISYGPVPASDFAVTPPSGAKVVKVATPAGHSAAAGGSHAGSAHAGAAHAGAADAGHAKRGRHATVSGVAAVAKHLSFPLVAPRSLVGLTRRSVTLLDWNHTPAALVAYGQNLGGIAVIEQVAQGAATQAAKSSGDQPGLSLPTVSINGATGQELDTALGTMVRFTRAGVAYTVVGSVPPSAAELAARAL